MSVCMSVCLLICLSVSSKFSTKSSLTIFVNFCMKLHNDENPRTLVKIIFLISREVQYLFVLILVTNFKTTMLNQAEQQKNTQTCIPFQLPNIFNLVDHSGGTILWRRRKEWMYIWTHRLLKIKFVNISRFRPILR